MEFIIVIVLGFSIWFGLHFPKPNNTSVGLHRGNFYITKHIVGHQSKRRTYHENIQTESYIIKNSPLSNPCKSKTGITYIDTYGYRRFSNSNKLVSRWIAEKYIIHHKLECGQVVHHIDGNKLNNKPINLMVFNSQEEHRQYHQNYYNNNGTWHSKIPEYSDYAKYSGYTA